MSEQALELQVISNSTQAVGELSKLASALGRIQRAVEKGFDASGVAKQMQAFSEAIQNAVPEETVQKLERISGAIDSLKSAGSIKVKVDTQTANIEDTLEPQTNGIKEIERELNGMVESGQAASASVASSADEIADKYINATSTIDLLKMKLEALKSELAEGIKDQSFDDKKIVDYTIRIQNLKEQILDLSNQKVNFSELFGNAFSGAVKSAKTILSGITNEFRSMASAAKSAVSGFAKGIGNIAKGTARLGINALGKAFSAMRERIASSTSSLGKFFSSIKRIAVYRAIRSMIKMITTGFKEGVDNLYKYSKAMNGDFAQSMDMGASVSLQFKNSIAAALAPAISAAISLISSLASIAITAANAINQLIAALSGASVWTRATRGASEYEKAAKGAGGATKDLLADWDELNIIQSQGGGGGGGASEYADMFTTENLPDNEWTQLAQRIREAIEKGDWAGVGRIIAEKINGLLDSFDPKALSDKFNSAIRKALKFQIGFLSTIQMKMIGKKIGDFLLGVFGDDNLLNWRLWGEALRLKVVAAMQMIQGVVETPGLFEGIGTSLAETVNSFFELDGAQIESISGAFGGTITGIAKGAVSFFDDTDFEKIGQKINQILNRIFGEGGTIDWKAIGKALRKGFMSIFDFLHGLLFGNNEVENALRSRYENTLLEPYLDQMFGNTDTGLFTGLGKNIADAINSAFEFSKIDISTIAGVFHGTINKIVTEAKDLIVNTDLEGIGTTINDLLQKMFGAGDESKIKWADIGETIKQGILAPFRLLKNIAKNPEEDTEGILSTIGSGMAEALTKALTFDKNEIDEMSKVVGKGLVDVLSGINSFIKDTDWKSIADSIGQFISRIPWDNVFDGVGELILNAFIASLDIADTIGKYLEYWISNTIAHIVNKIIGAELMPEFANIESYELYSKLGKLEGFLKNEKGQYIFKGINGSAEELQETLSGLEEQMENLRNNLIMGTGIDPADSNFAKIVAELQQKVDEGFWADPFGFLDANRKLSLIKEFYQNGQLIYDQMEAIKSVSDEAADSMTDYADATKEAASGIDIPSVHETVPIWLTYVPEIEDIQDDQMDFNLEYDAEATKPIKAPVEIIPEYVYATESALRYNMEGFEKYYGRANEKGMANAELFYDTGIKENITQMLERAGYDATSEAAQSILQNFHDQWIKFASTEDYDWDVTINDLIASLKESIEDPSQLILDNPLPAVDGSDLVGSLANINSEVAAEAAQMESSVQRFLNAVYMLNGITLRGGVGGSSLRFGVSNKPMYTFAEGGFPTTGDMFIAREAGPELVGRMGNKTAVANNDQIVNGVANGVAAGQAEQNALLRQQNEYLRRILAKESTVKVEPSASWGRFNKRSEEMRARGAGA